MTILEREPIPVSTQVNGGPEVVVSKERKAGEKIAEILTERANFVAGAWEKGWYQFLAKKQRLALGRYLEIDDNSGRIPSLEAWRKKLKDNGLIDIGRQALFRHEQVGFSRLREISSEEEKREQQEENLRQVVKNLYEAEGLIPYSIARRLRIPRETVCQIIDQSDDIQRRKKGRPPRYITIYDRDLIEFNLRHLQDKGLSNKEIGDKVTLTPGYVKARLRRSNGGNLVSQENH